MSSSPFRSRRVDSQRWRFGDGRDRRANGWPGRTVRDDRSDPNPLGDRGGRPGATEQLLPLVYDELRKLAAQKLAQEKPGQTLQATALVHEAYLRLVDPGGERPWDNRVHFLAAAAEAMRRILIDRARDRKRLKRGGDRRRQELDLESLSSKTMPRPTI